MHLVTRQPRQPILYEGRTHAETGMGWVDGEPLNESCRSTATADHVADSVVGGRHRQTNAVVGRGRAGFSDVCGIEIPSWVEGSGIDIAGSLE